MSEFLDPKTTKLIVDTLYHTDSDLQADIFPKKFLRLIRRSIQQECVKFVQRKINKPQANLEEKKLCGFAQRSSSDSDDEVEIISDVESIITVPDSEDETNPDEGKVSQNEPGRKTSYSSELPLSRVQSPSFPADDSLDDESNEDDQPTSSKPGTASQHQDDTSLIDHVSKAFCVLHMCI
ncbi:hypothetical protein J6590_070097 [Homalodisca vitripennis]|nr:hypothetical protein J6590_070097 [Homalodisca vitripennis]